MPLYIHVNVGEPLEGDLPDHNPMCEGSSVRLDASSYDATTYVWTSLGYVGQKFGALQTERPTETTMYYVDVQRGACEKRDSILVEVNTRPEIDWIDSLDVRVREIVLKNGLGTPPFQYGVDHFLLDDSPVKSGLLFGIHEFHVVDHLGCVSDAFGYLMEAPKIFPPVYFTPNGDGVNDTWEVGNLELVYPDAVVEIYDRYGKQLVQYKGSAPGWDGTYLGRDMPATDYWYVIDINEIGQQYVGHFTLLRR